MNAGERRFGAAGLLRWIGLAGVGDSHRRSFAFIGDKELGSSDWGGGWGWAWLTIPSGAGTAETSGDLRFGWGALDAAIARGMADIEAGQVHGIDAVCDALDAELAGL